jgi:hypothetical protein
MPTNYLAGWGGSCVIGSQSIAIQNNSATETNNLVDVTGTLSNGKMQYVPGLEGVQWSFKGVFDGSNPPSGRAGSVVSLTFTNVSGIVGFACSTAIVESFEEDLDVTGAIKFTVSGRSNGAYTFAGV